MEIIEVLGDGLVVRRATAADTESLAIFNAEMHGVPGTDVGAYVAAWVRDLMAGHHPTCAPSDFVVVEETRSGDIVSSLNLISQTWVYHGIPFGVGRIEFVGTRPDFRRRGLIRRLMAIVHRWSTERGHLIQSINGIPHYYRRFGYEMALDLDAGRTGYPAHVPDLPEGQAEPFRIRPATLDDVPFVAGLDAENRTRWLISAVRDHALWRHELDGPHDAKRRASRIVEAADGRPVGYLVHAADLWGRGLVVHSYELEPGASWLAVTPPVLRYLRATAETYGERAGAGPWDRFVFAVGSEHPVYRAIPDRLPRTRPPYAWYLRVPDLPAFLRRISPVLEDRLAAFVAAGHSGELRIGFYGEGVRLSLARGRIERIEAWESGDDWETAPAFPGLTFLQLLFGYRSLAELEYAFPDCRVTDEEERTVLVTMFPKQPSYVWSVD